jgi:pyruvate dehydrogenase E2 component (dihydrolipoamide acetyltransferase)
MAFEFKFPDVGEGISEGELLAWQVTVGDVVAEDQTLAEIETDKAVVEIPSPRAGRIAALHAEEGDVIKVGQVLVTIEEEAAERERAEPEEAAPAAEKAPAEKAPAVEKAPGEGEDTRRVVPVPPVAQVEEQEEFYTGSVVGQLEEAPPEEEEEWKRERREAARVTSVKVLAMPSVRSLAAELGVDLARVQGTGPGGRVLRQDVEDYAQAAAYGRTSIAVPSVAPEEIETAQACMDGCLEQDDYGVIERVEFRGVRRTMAKHMATALARQALVTETDEVDVSVLRRIREKQRTLADERGIHLTYLAFVLKAVTLSLQRFPRLNAVLSEGCDEVVIKRYYNIGIAVDTSAGLMVPNIKDADKKSIFELAKEINELVARAQERKLDVADLHGGTFTVSNYGAIGAIYATPITNYPEVAILGMGRVRDKAVVSRGDVTTAHMLPLSITFDHQLIDGAEAARFLNLVMSYLEDPDIMLLEGA